MAVLLAWGATFFRVGDTERDRGDEDGLDTSAETDRGRAAAGASSLDVDFFVVAGLTSAYT